MLVYGVDHQSTLAILAKGVGLEPGPVKAKGLAWQFSLRPNGEVYWRVNARGARMPKACWHGYLAFFSRLFGEYPNARAVTRMVTYDGKAEFDRLHGQTYGLVNHTGEECTCRMR